MLGKNSGADSIKIWLDRVGHPLPPEETVLEILQMVKARALQKKSTLTLRDFENILAKFALAKPAAKAGD